MFPLPLATGPSERRGKSKSIYQPFMTRSANSVPRGRGVRGAARGLEREVKCPGATQKSAMVKVVNFYRSRTSDLKRSDEPFGRANIYSQLNEGRLLRISKHEICRLNQKILSASSGLASRCRSNAGAHRMMVASLEVSSWPGQRGPPYLWRLSERHMRHYQEGVVVLLQDGPQLGRW
jgi:hypothetical protein